MTLITQHITRRVTRDVTGTEQLSWLVATINYRASIAPTNQPITLIKVDLTDAHILTTATLVTSACALHILADALARSDSPARIYEVTKAINDIASNLTKAYEALEHQKETS